MLGTTLPRTACPEIPTVKIDYEKVFEMLEKKAKVRQWEKN